MRTLLAALVALVAATVDAGTALSPHDGPLFDQRSSYAMGVGTLVRAPIGWTEFCAENFRKGECQPGRHEPEEVKLTWKKWSQLNRINAHVNRSIKPKLDIDHYGQVEKWAYPDDGYGDCEDYVLLKRKMLMEAGWPRSALLITVVRDERGDGHAILTVMTDRGEFILDNQEESIRAWRYTKYRFVKRQSLHSEIAWQELVSRDYLGFR